MANKGADKLTNKRADKRPKEKSRQISNNKCTDKLTDKRADKRPKGEIQFCLLLLPFRSLPSARSKTSTRQACARFAMSVKRDLKGNNKRDDEVAKRCALRKKTRQSKTKQDMRRR